MKKRNLILNNEDINVEDMHLLIDLYRTLWLRCKTLEDRYRVKRDFYLFKEVIHEGRLDVAWEKITGTRLRR